MWQQTEAKHAVQQNVTSYISYYILGKYNRVANVQSRELHKP